MALFFNVFSAYMIRVTLHAREKNEVSEEENDFFTHYQQIIAVLYLKVDREYFSLLSSEK
jgi:hypothetical protein